MFDRMFVLIEGQYMPTQERVRKRLSIGTEGGKQDSGPPYRPPSWCSDDVRTAYADAYRSVG